MAYTDPHMRILGPAEISERIADHTLTGFYYLYDDNTEAQIDKYYATQDILNHIDNGGKIGEELPGFMDADTRETELGCLDEIIAAINRDNMQTLMAAYKYAQAKSPDHLRCFLKYYGMLDKMLESTFRYKLLHAR